MFGVPPGDCWVSRRSHSELQPNSVHSLRQVQNFLFCPSCSLALGGHQSQTQKQTERWPSKKGLVPCPRGTAGPGGDPTAAPVAWEEGVRGGQHGITQDDSVRGGSHRKDTRPRASWPAVPTPHGTDPVLPAKTPATGPGGHETKPSPGRSPTSSPSMPCPGCRHPHTGRSLTESLPTASWWHCSSHLIQTRQRRHLQGIHLAQASHTGPVHCPLLYGKDCPDRADGEGPVLVPTASSKHL